MPTLEKLSAHDAHTYAVSAFSYLPETGTLSKKWRDGEWRECKAIGSAGYIQAHFLDTVCYAHRIAWLLMTGSFPAKTIDHINRMRTDNRWSNLRLATRNQQMWNTGNLRSNTTGCRGVSPYRGRWRAVIYYNGVQTYLGCFSSVEDASRAYAIAAQAQFKEFYAP